MKFTLSISKNEVALPLSVSLDLQKSHWFMQVRILMFVFRGVHVYAPKVVDVPASPEVETFKATKAYADQRQKSPRRRKHKPSKAMRNLYQLQ
jgi:hypothetical protein